MEKENKPQVLGELPSVTGLWKLNYPIIIGKHEFKFLLNGISKFIHALYELNKIYSHSLGKSLLPVSPHFPVHVFIGCFTRLLEHSFVFSSPRKAGFSVTPAVVFNYISLTCAFFRAKQRSTDSKRRKYICYLEDLLSVCKKWFSNKHTSLSLLSD